MSAQGEEKVPALFEHYGAGDGWIFGDDCGSGTGLGYDFGCGIGAYGLDTGFGCGTGSGRDWEVIEG